MICILLATYNGEKFLKDQIDSIVQQTVDDWILHIRDDGSTDRTSSIIERYTQQYPSKVVFHKDGLHLGACQSFLQLLRLAHGDYYMFCDQDDVWLPNKIDLTLSKMKQEEEKFIAPILIHTDMTVVDSSLNEIASSFWKQMRLLPQYNTYYDLLACHNANGCTIMLNEQAKTETLRASDTAPMHDIWAALAVSAHENGVVTYIEDKTMLYRQHANNVIGSRNTSISTLLKKIVNIRTIVMYIWDSPKRYAMLRPTSRWKFLWHKIKIVFMRFIN